MKMKPIVLMAAMALAVNVQAQSLEEGIKMYKYERYESAKKQLMPLMTSNPLANYYYGLSILELQATDAAKSIFAKYPDNYANISGMARVAFAEGRTAEGMQIASGLAGKAKKKEWEQLKYAADAITYTDGGDVQQAITWYKAALAINDNADLHLGLGEAYLKQPTGGGEAMSNFEKITEKDPKNSLAFSRIGKLWYQAKNYALALENYEKAQQADPTNPLPYRELATAYSLTGKYELAKQNMEKYLERSDKSPEDIQKYMEILYLAHYYKEAADKAQEFINKGNAKPSYYGIIGYSQYELSDSANKYGLENVRRYLNTNDPKKVTPNDYRGFAKVLLKNNMGDSANFYFNKAVASDTAANKADAYRENAEALREGREWLLSAEWYKKLVTSFADKAKALDYFYWGVCAYYGHDFPQAATAFEQMETKFPDQPSATYWRGRTAAAIDNEAKQGTAEPFYIKWLNFPNYERKSADLMQAYQYLALYYYNKGDKENAKKYLDEIEKIDANNSFLKQMRDVMNKAAAPAKKGK